MISMTNQEFMRLVHQTYVDIPPHVAQRLDNVDVVVEEWPRTDLQNLTSEDESLFGVYHGVPLTEREGGDPMLPDLIVIYRQPILRSCSTRTEAEHEIKVTLWHEIGHYLGMSEDDLDRLGYG